MQRKLSRYTLFAAWFVVSSLAVAGFAVFSVPRETTELPPPITIQTGRNAGAVAAMAFVYGSGDEPITASTVDLDHAVQGVIERKAASATTETAGATRTTTFVRTSYMSEPEVRALIERFFRPEDVNRAVRIAWCESSFNPRAVNPTTGAAGLFQHLPSYWPERAAEAGFGGSDIFDPEANVAVAAWLVYEYPGGWSHWTCNP
ncbi:MAG: hypothetical protein KatS3mg011_1375 [Acidimicrobiia bacterium]|nr:MAG: hypothetical protein KatS3mg011_1375 [Acidimicrobiia bacterium]